MKLLNEFNVKKLKDVAMRNILCCWRARHGSLSIRNGFYDIIMERNAERKPVLDDGARTGVHHRNASTMMRVKYIDDVTVEDS